MVTDDESSLIERARQGDRDALAALLERHQAEVYRFSMKLCRHPDDAQGVLQDTMLDAVRGIAQFRGDAALSTWLYTLARSRCIKRRRKGKHAPDHFEALDDQLDLEEPQRAPDDALGDRRLLLALDRALAELDEPDREVLVLRDVEGVSGKEAADILGLSLAAMKSRLHRAREALRAKLRPLVEEPAAIEGGVSAGPGASCPDIVRAFSEQLEGDLSPVDCATLEHHLEGCPRCHQVCDSLKRVLSVCRSVPTPDVPEPVKRSVREAVRLALAGGALPGRS